MDQFFNHSPFSLIADENAARCWAGRQDVLKDLERIRRGWASRSDSTLDLMWANLGAGKTHTLFHLRHLLATEESSVVTYIEVPEHLGKFVELYRRIAGALPIEQLAQLAIRLQHSTVDSRLERAFRAIAVGNAREAGLAKEWVIGGRPGLRELKSITAIDSRIEDDVDAETILSDMVRILHRNDRRLVLLFDEFQRVGHLPHRSREALLSHVRSLFSSNPAHLSIVLAAGSRIEKTAVDLLPPELKTLMGMRRHLTLPEMDAEEAKEFLLRRFAHFRPNDYMGNAMAPFGSDLLDSTIEYLVGKAKIRLTPRALQQVFGFIYDEILGVPNSQLAESELRKLLDGLNWGAFETA